MKKLFVIVTCLMCSVMLFAQGGVDFQHLTFDEALAKAKAEKKLVFMDCYTTWCGPCKYMTTKIFPQEKAGEFFNPRFVCVKFDMEQGEGKELKTKLGVRAFPSFFIIRPDGTVQHCIVGGGELEPFIERVKLGLNTKTSLEYLTRVYESGKMNKKQLAAYYRALTDAYDKKNSEKVYGELMAQLTDKDKLKADYWSIFEAPACKIGTPDFNLILTNIPVFEKNIGKEKLDEYLFDAYSRALSAHVNGRGAKESVSLDDLKKQIDGLTIAKKADLLAQYDLAVIVKDKDVKKLVSLFEQKAETLSGNDLWGMLSAVRNLEAAASKEDLGRIAAAGEKVMANPANAETKDYLEQNFEHYKKMAHVGVYFEDLTFEQALEKAQKQRKMIFMDGYTSWCGPCKYMSGTVFPQEKSGDYLNRFICVKYDMEKGEGPELAKKFGIRAYPTFVIINSDGTVRHKLVGGGEADQFIERVKEAFDDTKATGLLDAKYNEGNRDKDFLVLYVNSLKNLYSPDVEKVAGELYQTLNDEEKVSPAYWFLFENRDMSPEGSEAAKYLMANRDRFTQSVGKEKVDKCLSSGYQRKLSMILGGRDTKSTVKDVDQIKKDIVALKLSNEKSLLATANIAKAVLGGNQNQLLTVCEKEVSQMTGEEFPIMVAYNAKAKATPAQMSRWMKVCQKVIANCQNPDYAKRIEGMVKGMEAK